MADLDYKTIKAAVAGEKWATEKVVEHYDGYITELATVKDEGGMSYVDEDMKQAIIVKLLEEIPKFPME